MAIYDQPSTVDDETYDEYMESLEDEDLSMHLEWGIDYWRDRNTYIEEIRKHIEGLNDIKTPKSRFYIAKVLRAYSFSAIINEKQARYLLRPEAQVLVEDPTDQDQVTTSSEVERALKWITYEAERIGDGDTWDRVLIDLHLLDEGVMKVLFNPALHWQELVKAEKRSLREVFKNPFERGSKRREKYMLEKGCPIETYYVPLENYLPIYEGSYLRHNFEVDVKSAYSCRNSPMFDQSAFNLYEDGKYGGLDVMVPIIHHANDLFYAYYALPPGTTSSDPDNRLKINPNSMTSSGDMSLLYVFKHGLGRNNYNPIAGRYGGWKTQNNRIEFVNKGIMQMSQARDEMWSQMYTNIRASDWPRMKVTINPELRGYGQGGVETNVPDLDEGDEVYIFSGEDISPILQPAEDPKVPWLMGQIEGQLGNLGGSSVLFGQRQPGVDNGYQNQQQISQAEHLDSKVEEHLAQGAIQFFTILMQYAKVLGEPIPGYYLEPPGLEGKKRSMVVKLDPKKLDPLPKIDAKVRKTRPVDFMMAGRLAKDLSDDRGGKGALLSDYTIYTEILGRDSPDVEKMLVRIEAMERQALEDGTVMKMIVDATNLKVAKQTQQQLAPGAVGGSNPAALQAALQHLQGAAQTGGIDVNLLTQLLQQALTGGGMPGQGLPGQLPNGQGGLGGNVTGHQNGGMVLGDPGTEARIGEAVAAQEII